MPVLQNLHVVSPWRPRKARADTHSGGCWVTPLPLPLCVWLAVHPVSQAVHAVLWLCVCAAFTVDTPRPSHPSALSPPLEISKKKLLCHHHCTTTRAQERVAAVSKPGGSTQRSQWRSYMHSRRARCDEHTLPAPSPRSPTPPCARRHIESWHGRRRRNRSSRESTAVVVRRLHIHKQWVPAAVRGVRDATTTHKGTEEGAQRHRGVGTRV